MPSPLLYSRLSRPSQTLTTLELQYNSIQAAGAKYLADALRINQVTGRLLLLLYSLLAHPSQTLTTLDLQYSCIGADGAKHLADTLRTNQVTRRLLTLF